jgi:hypothetical protein
MEGQEIQNDVSGPGDFSPRFLAVDGFQVVAQAGRNPTNRWTGARMASSST